MTVRLPGGGHRFDDGSMIYSYANYYHPARNGEIHVFFLKRAATGLRQFEMCGGPQSHFRLDFANDKVVPADTMLRDPLVQKYKGSSIRDFLRGIHRIESSPGVHK